MKDRYLEPESIVWFTEDQVFLLLTRPLSPSPVSKFSLFLSLPVWSPIELIDGRGSGRGTQSYDWEEAWPSIYYSILSGESERCIAGFL